MSLPREKNKHREKRTEIRFQWRWVGGGGGGGVLYAWTLGDIYVKKIGRQVKESLNHWAGKCNVFWYTSIFLWPGN